MSSTTAGDLPASLPVALADESDAALVGQMAAGDAQALAVLYDRHASLLLGLARRILQDPADAEEVLQETFLQAWNQAGRYDQARSSVSTWLVLIARSRAIDRLRTRQVVDRTLAALEQEPLPDTSSPGIASVLSQEREVRIRHELSKLPPEQTEVLHLAFYRGLSQSQIAAQTGIPLGTVKTRTLLALRKLRQALQSEIEEWL